ncbi:MAG: hypothetical protein KKE44_04655 [Proteobacteria bacterium]|nr:hypothetical protein [Pseudomonadota bacterium]MBU1582022.1 hypothetical protein [Pseudomonadota bacterium]MBU2632045.1 hypothetical protein [Pseudomonadota bacterium]
MTVWLKLARDRQKCFFQFGGQGSGFAKELKLLHSFPEMSEFFNFSFDVIKQGLKDPLLANSLFLQKGFDLKTWLENDTFPENSYIENPSISMSSILISQLAFHHYITKTISGNANILEFIDGFIGLSQGIYPGIFISLNLKGDSYWEGVSKFITALLYFGYVFDNVYVSPKISDTVMEKAFEMDNKAPKPMAMIDGLPHEILLQKINQYNKNKKRNLEISIVNNGISNIISGPEDLIVDFRLQHKKNFDAKKILWRYLSCSVPFHTQYYQAGYDLFHTLVKKVKFDYLGSDLQKPVYSTFDGTSLNCIGKLVMPLYLLNSTYNINWPVCVQRIADSPDISHVFDFGPGSATAYITKKLLTNYPIEVIKASRKNNLLKYFMNNDSRPDQLDIQTSRLRSNHTNQIPHACTA